MRRCARFERLGGGGRRQRQIADGNNAHGLVSVVEQRRWGLASFIAKGVKLFNVSEFDACLPFNPVAKTRFESAMAFRIKRSEWEAYASVKPVAVPVAGSLRFNAQDFRRIRIDRCDDRVQSDADGGGRWRRLFSRSTHERGYRRRVRSAATYVWPQTKPPLGEDRELSPVFRRRDRSWRRARKEQWSAVPIPPRRPAFGRLCQAGRRHS